jgi:AcrR family transcriptional regulator
MKSSGSPQSKGSVSAAAGRAGGKGVAKPRKRPTQDRAKFTLQAIYDAYVRIWRRDGPAAATTRAVAEESGFAVGTIYDYFPNRAALHSGYVRHVIEAHLTQIDRDVIAGPGDWRRRLARLVEITCGADPDAPYFDAEMLDRVAAVAEPWHHRRVFDELTGKWAEAIAGWPDLAAPPPRATVDILVLAVWGARRYRLHVDPPADRLADWVERLTRLCERALEG